MSYLEHVTGTVVTAYFYGLCPEDSSGFNVLGKLCKIIEETNAGQCWIGDPGTSRLLPSETCHLFSPRQVGGFASCYLEVEIQAIFHPVFFKAHLIHYRILIGTKSGVDLAGTA